MRFQNGLLRTVGHEVIRAIRKNDFGGIIMEKWEPPPVPVKAEPTQRLMLWLGCGPQELNSA